MSRAGPASWLRCSTDRAPFARKNALTLDQQGSIGERSGEYRGKKRISKPALVKALITVAARCAQRLAMTITALGLSRSKAGMSPGWTEARNTTAEVAASMVLRWSFDGHRGDHPVQAQRAEKRQPMPVAARNRPTRPCASRCTRMQPSHLCSCSDPGFVEDDKTASVDVLHFLLKGFALYNDVWTVLLAGTQSLFFRTRFSFWRARQSDAVPSWQPVRPRSCSPYSVSVASFCSKTRSFSVARPAASSFGGGPPACGFAARRPSVRATCNQV